MDIQDIIKVWAETFNLPVSDTTDFNKVSDIAYELIKEEMSELKLALETRDCIEILDGMGDVVWVIIRWLQEAGIDFYDIMDIVSTSNHSKYLSKTEYLERQSFYDTNYKVEVKEVLGYERYILRDKETGKIKKPHTFRQPNFNKYEKLLNIQENDIIS